MNSTQHGWSTRLPAAVFALLALASPVVAGQEAVSITRQDQKTVPIVAFAAKGSTCRGVAVVSHGAGGSEKGYRYLGEALSNLGYLAVVVGHQESGMPAVRARMRGSALREALASLITDPDAYRGRFMDIAASRPWAQARCAGGESVLVGHSMGAATVMLEAGAQNQLGLRGADTFTTYIALSPQGVGSIFPTNAWARIGRPVLTITGTRDDELGGGSWDVRTEPYKNMPAGCKWLAVLNGASHMQLAGIGMPHDMEALTVQVIGAFLDGARRGDCTAPPPDSGLDLQTK